MNHRREIWDSTGPGMIFALAVAACFFGEAQAATPGKMEKRALGSMQSAPLAKPNNEASGATNARPGLAKPDNEEADSSFSRNTIPRLAPVATNTLVRTQGKKLTYNTPWGPVVVEQMNDGPTCVIDTEHYHVVSRSNEMDPVGDIGTVLEAAYPVWKDFFGCVPPDKYLKMEIYANAKHFAEVMQREGFGASFSGGGYCHSGTRKAYLYWQQAGVPFTRYLMLHEATHQFQLLTGACPAIPDEGLADYFGMHTWDGKKLAMGVVTPDAPVLSGRPAAALRTIKDNAAKDGRPRNINDLLALGTDRAGEWGLVHFLINRDPAGFRKVFFQPEDTPLNEAWRRQYETVSLPPDMFDSCTRWLEKMQGYREDDVAFFSWARKTAANPPVADRNRTNHAGRGKH